MILTKRERTTAIIVGSAVSLIAVYYFFLGPYVLDKRADISMKLKAKQGEAADQNAILKQGRAAEDQLNKLEAEGLTGDPSRAAQEIARGMTSWASSAPFPIPSLTFVSQKVEQSKLINNDTYFETRAQYIWSGQAANIESFLIRLESTPLPIRLNSMAIRFRTREGFDDLTVDFNVSTISPNLDAGKGKPAGDAAVQ